MADAESEYQPQWRLQTKTHLKQLGARPRAGRDKLLAMLGVPSDAVSEREIQTTLEVLEISWKAIENFLTKGGVVLGDGTMRSTADLQLPDDIAALLHTKVMAAGTLRHIVAELGLPSGSLDLSTPDQMKMCLVSPRADERLVREQRRGQGTDFYFATREDEERLIPLHPALLRPLENFVRREYEAHQIYPVVGLGTVVGIGLYPLSRFEAERSWENFHLTPLS